MTETLTHIAIKKLNGDAKSNYYSVLQGVSISQDDRGCLEVCSPVNFNQKITTNDLVHLISDSEFEWLGRIDNVINSGGIYLYWLMDGPNINLSRSFGSPASANN